MTKERPIIFSAESILAILDGDKTQTRRVIKPQPEPRGSFITNDGRLYWCTLSDAERVSHPDPESLWRQQNCPYGQPGDHLWVRETFCLYKEDGPWDSSYPDDIVVWETKLPKEMPKHLGRYPWRIWPRANGGDDDYKEIKWRSPIHMPRWASRITLKIEGVSVEWLRNISEEDARAESPRDVVPLPSQRPQWPIIADYDPVNAYRHMWNGINGDKPGCNWDSNPLVWVIKFRKVE